MTLSTNDLRFLAEKILNKVDFDPKEFDLDETYLSDVRDALLHMADELETTGKVEIVVLDEEIKDDCKCDDEKPKNE